MKPLHIVMNTWTYAFVTPGGGEIQLLKTAEALRQLGHRVTFWNNFEPPKEPIDIIHFFSVQGGNGNFLINSKARDYPLAISPILWPKGDTSHYPMDEIRWAMGLADVLLPNSEMEADLLSEVFGTPRDRFHVAHNGIDPIFLSDKDSTGDLFRQAHRVTEPFLLCVGNIEHRKNQIFLATAAARLKIKTYLIGHVRDENFLQEALQAGQGFCEYLGAMDHHSPLLRSALRACSVFVLPSTLETPGLAALEAAAMGCQIVVTEEGSTREYFAEDAVYCDPKSLDSIVHAIQKATSAPAPSRLRARMQNFGWKNTAEQTLFAYLKILKK